jgi:hypothetical protein
LGDCAWDKAAPHIWANTIKINAGLAVTIDYRLLSICFVLTLFSVFLASTRHVYKQ